MRDHGTRAKYTNEGCRCPDCRNATRLYELERRNSLTPRLVSADPARAHVRELMAAGMGHKRIAELAGVSMSAVGSLLYGKPGRPPTRRIKPATAQALLSVTATLDTMADGALVDAAATHANVAKLVAAGVPKVRIAERLGWGSFQVDPDQTQVRSRTARVIAEMVAELDAGTLVSHRGSRYGDTVIAPEAVERPPRTFAEADEIDRFLNEMADIILDKHQPWRAQAACRGDDRPMWLWFSARGDVATQRKARAICRACPVADDCLAYAESQRVRVGIWGGQSIHKHLKANPPTVACDHCGGMYVAQGPSRYCGDDCRHAVKVARQARYHQRKAS